MKNVDKTFLLILRCILFISIIVSLIFYFTTRKNIQKSTSIVYTVNRQSRSNWRGTAYRLSINYANKEQTITISRATSDSIEKGKLPLLYYNGTFDTAVYDFHLEFSLRIAIVFTILLCISLLLKPKIKN